MVKYLTDGADEGHSMGQTTADLISLYGVTPVSQRAANQFHAQSVLSVSSNITIAASLTACLLEIAATLTALGAWNGNAS